MVRVLGERVFLQMHDHTEMALTVYGVQLDGTIWPNQDLEIGGVVHLGVLTYLDIDTLKDCIGLLQYVVCRGTS